MLQLNFVSYRYNFIPLNSFAMPIRGPVVMLKVFYDGKNGGKGRVFFPEGILSIQLSVMVPLETLESSLHVTSLKEPVTNFLMTAVLSIRSVTCTTTCCRCCVLLHPPRWVPDCQAQLGGQVHLLPHCGGPGARQVAGCSIS